VLPLVAEDGAELGHLRRSGNQMVPIIMSDLMTEMAEQRAIRFTHRAPLALAFGVVGFGDIDGDQSAGMPGDDRRGLRSGKKVKGKTVRIFAPGSQRQSKF